MSSKFIHLFTDRYSLTQERLIEQLVKLCGLSWTESRTNGQTVLGTVDNISEGAEILQQDHRIRLVHWLDVGQGSDHLEGR